MKNFSVTEAIGFGWEITKRKLVFFIFLILFVLFISFLTNIVPSYVLEETPLLSVIISIVSFVINIFVQMGLIRITLKFCDNREGEFNDLRSTFPLFFKFLLGVVLYSLIIIAGLILLVVPGIIWGIRYQYVGYLIIDQNLDPIEALKKSSEITSGFKWDLFLFNIILGLINIMGFLLLIVGLFVSVPTTILAYAFVYRKLTSQLPENTSPEYQKIGW